MTTYADLKANVAAWMNRSDLTPYIPTFVLLVERRMQSGSPDLGIENPIRLRSQLTTVNPFTNPLPANFGEMKRVSWVLSGTAPNQIKYPLDFMSLETIGPYEGISGRPQFYSINGSSLVFGPTFSNDVEIIYYAIPTALSSDADIVQANLEPVYLYGTMLEAALFMKDDAQAQRVGIFYKNAVNGLLMRDLGDAHSGAGLRMRSDARIKP